MKLPNKKDWPRCYAARAVQPGTANRRVSMNFREVTMLRRLTMMTLLPIALAMPAAAQDAQSTAAATYRDIEATIGSVPTFWKLFPEEGVAGAWAENKAVMMNPKTALSAKEKHLIALGVAAQIPCSYCIYAHTAAAKLNGATDAEIREAVAVAAIVRHGSTVANGMQEDLAVFKQETDAANARAAERMKAAKQQ
jgi:AhpD family alkylhydroperoxidase